MTVECQDKLEQSQSRLMQAVSKVFGQNPEFTGQIELELHCKNGIVVDVYEIRRRRKV